MITAAECLWLANLQRQVQRDVDVAMSALMQNYLEQISVPGADAIARRLEKEFPQEPPPKREG